MEMIPVVFSVEVVEAMVFEIFWIIPDGFFSIEVGVRLVVTLGLAVLVLLMEVVLLLVDKPMVDVVKVVLVTLAVEAMLDNPTEGVSVEVEEILFVVVEIVVVEMGLFFKNSCKAKKAMSKYVKKV